MNIAIVGSGVVGQATGVGLASNGNRVIFHDLYQEKFDAILPYDEIPRDAELNSEIEKHCQELEAAQGIVIVHPNWWGQPPAILKGWIDRVIRAGIAYKFCGRRSG